MSDFDFNCLSCPKDQVLVQDGKVMVYSEWVLWNGEPHECIRIMRRKEGVFSAYIGDPEHGGRTLVRSNVVEALSGLHEKLVQKFETMFALENITDATQLIPLFHNPLWADVVIE